MKKRKIILLILVLIPLLFGCNANAEYSLVVYDNEVSENVNLLLMNNTDNSSKITDELEYPTIALDNEVFDTYTDEKIDGVPYYTKKRIDKNGLIGINYFYKFDTDNYKDSSAFNFCYDNASFIKEDKYLILSTNKFNKCIEDYDVDEIKIHLKTNHKVKQNNADEVDGYNYYWRINKSNYDDKNIYIMLYKNKYVFNYEGEAIPYIIGSIIIAILVLTVIIVLRKKSKKNNNV